VGLREQAEPATFTRPYIVGPTSIIRPDKLEPWKIETIALPVVSAAE
jgi:hypothetical protein